MSRMVWFVAGSAAGAYAVARARRAAEVLTYDGVHDRLSGLFVGARMFADEVRTGAAEKEAELRDRLEGHRHLESAEARPGLTSGPDQRATATNREPLTLVRGNDH